MNVITCQPDESTLKELAIFIGQTRSEEVKQRYLSLEELAANLAECGFLSCLLARSDKELIGFALLYRIGDSELIEINPGTLLGHHPFVAPGFDEEVVGAALVEAAKECVRREGFGALYIDIPWDPAAAQESYDVYLDRYGALGFVVIQHMRQMRVSLPVEIPEIILPEGVQLAQIQTADREALYRCHHESYLAGDAQYYFQMDDAERRDDFERIYAPNIRAHPGSFVLTRDGCILGYCLLFAEGTFSELMSVAVHPDDQRRGYGRLLVNACLKRAGEAGLTNMHLIVDVNNRKAESLYRQCGFQDIGGSMTFKWKAVRGG